jgi:SOS-response transcriptional repressor LexA
VAVRPALSGRQALILDTIRASVRDHGYPPSLRELAKATEINSTSTVADDLRRLAARGWIRVAPGIPRGIVLVDDHQEPTLTGAGVQLNMARHRYGTPGYIDRNRCPGCGAENLNTTVGITKVGYTYEVCTCRDDDHTYDHLMEQLWHRACLTVSGCP